MSGVEVDIGKDGLTQDAAEAMDTASSDSPSRGIVEMMVDAVDAVDAVDVTTIACEHGRLRPNADAKLIAPVSVSPAFDSSRG